MYLHVPKSWDRNFREFKALRIDKQRGILTQAVSLASPVFLRKRQSAVVSAPARLGTVAELFPVLQPVPAVRGTLGPLRPFGEATVN